MKNKFIHSVLLFGVVSFGIACSSKNENASLSIVDKEQIKIEIQAKEDEYAQTYNSRELKNIGYYADDAISYSQNKRPLIGKEAIVNFLKEGISSSIVGSKISFVTNEVFPSSDGNQVVEIGYYTFVNDKDSLINSGNYMVLFEKRNGSYISVREMSVSDISFQ